MSYKIDASDSNNLSQKILDERETRKRLLAHGRLVGCEKDMILLFEKFDKMMRNCKNEKERADISALGCVELHNLLGNSGQLYVNNKLVLDKD